MADSLIDLQMYLQAVRDSALPEPLTLETAVRFVLGLLDEAEAEAVVSAAGASRADRKVLARAVRRAGLFPTLEGALAVREFGHNLPAQRSDFVGREQVLADLVESLAAQVRPFVTIVAAGGIGKSWLAMEAARELTTEFEDGVWRVEVDALESGEDLFRVLGQTVGVDSGEEPETAFTNWATSRRTLVVLDGFNASPSYVDRLESLLADCPDLQILATSRCVLGVAGEQTLSIRPMETDGEEAVQVFVASARHTDFQLTPQNLASVKRVCQRLVGVPIALSLAAGSLAHQSLAELSVAVDALPLAVGQHTQAVDQAYQLLSSQDRMEILCLASFAGPFGFEDARTVLGMDPTSLLDRLESFGVLQVQGDEYRLHDTAKESVNEGSLSFAEVQTVRRSQDAHAELYRGRAESVSQLLKDGYWASGTSQLLGDLANYRAAIRHAVRSEDYVVLGSFADALSRTLFEAGYLADFSELSEATYSAAEAKDDKPQMIRLLGLRGALLGRGGDNFRCLALWHKRLELSKSIGDVASSADALLDIAGIEFEAGNYETALACHDEADAIAESAKDIQVLANSYAHRSRVLLAGGNKEACLVYLEKADQLLPKCTERDFRLCIGQLIGFTCSDLGDVTRAAQAYKQVLKEAAEAHRVIWTGWALRNLAPLLEKDGDLEGACRSYCASVTVHNQYGTKHRQLARKGLEEFEARHGAEIKGLLQQMKETPWAQLIADIQST